MKQVVSQLNLERLEVRNYKSLYEFSLLLGDFNVLIGPNNSGKSNILDCLSFLSEITTKTVDRVFDARGGYDHVVYAGRVDEKIYIKTLLSIGKKKISYEIRLAEDKVMREKALDVSSNLPLLDRTPDGKTKIFNERRQETSSLGAVHTVTALMTFSTDPNLTKDCPTLLQLVEFLQNWRFYTLNPSVMRTSLDPRREYDIGKDGRSLALVLHTLVSQHLPTFKEIERTLKSAIEEIDELQSPLTEDGRTYAAIKEKPFKYPFDYHQLSDGTLNLLAHLLIVFSPTETRMTGGLIGIEEPEDYVHPRLLRFLVDVLKTAGTKMLIVTHSPYLLDAVNPKDVFIIRKVKGKTTYTSPKSKKELKKFLKEFSLGELWFSGELENAR